MTPIAPEHRQESIDELQDLIAMLQASEVITYQDLSQRLLALNHMIQFWQPEDGVHVKDAIAAIELAEATINQFIFGDSQGDTRANR
jgi:hypothetical protein